MFHIRRAEKSELNSIREFYYTHIDEMQSCEYKTAWQKGVYPSDAMLTTALQNGELFVGEYENRIISAMVVNHAFNEEYNNVAWPVHAAADEVMVIHALGVLPSYGGNGYAKQMVGYAIEHAKKEGQKALRLDVLLGNLPAVKLYTKAGFCIVETMQMYYEDTGFTTFELYELAL